MRKLVVEKSKKGIEEPGFYVDVSFMIGDADGYIDGNYGPFKDEKACMDFLDMLESIDDQKDFKLSNGEIMREHTPKCNVYWWIGNFYEAPDEVLEIPESKKGFITEELIEAIDFDIPKEPHDENDYLCDFTGYEVYYIDEDHRKLKVEYKQNDNSEGDEDEQKALRKKGRPDPRTWLPYLEFTEDDFSKLEIIVKLNGEGQLNWTIDKEKLQYYKDLKEWKSLLTFKMEKIEFIKWRVKDYGKLKDNPWRDINDNIID